LRVKIHKKIPENQKFWDYGERLKLGVVGGRDAYLGSESLGLSVPPRMRRGRGRGAGRRGEAERVWFCCGGFPPFSFPLALWACVCVSGVFFFFIFCAKMLMMPVILCENLG